MPQGIHFYEQGENMKLSTALIGLTGLTVVFAMAATAKGQNKELVTVPSVDLKRYAGVWYEIAKYPNKFQKDCVGNTVATYTLKGEGKFDVLNQCKEEDGSTKDAKGAGRVVDKTTNSKLKVRFAPSFLSFIGAVWGKYWIIDLGENYEYSVVGEPNREYLWILAREPKMDEAKYQEILRLVEEKGFDPSKIVKTPQDLGTERSAEAES